MAVNTISNRVKGWTYIGGTIGDARVQIPSSLYTDVFCLCYIDGDAAKTVSFSEMTQYTDARTYRAGFQISSSTYTCAIHSYKDGTWHGWSASENNVDKMSTTKFFWYAR